MIDYTIQKLQQTIETLECEKRFKKEIIQTLHDGVLVYTPDLQLQIVNQEAHRLLDLTPSDPFDLDQYPLFKNRKCTISFKFKRWMQKLIDAQSHHTEDLHIWYKPDSFKQAKHYLFSAKLVYNPHRRVEAVLLVIYDLTAQTLSDSQERLLQAAMNSFDGQFFTNEKGYITKPNFAFSAYTGLMPNELKAMNIIQWLKKQVTLAHPVEDILKTLLEEGKWSGEIQLHPDNQTVFYAVLRLTMITDKEGNIETYVGTLQDITDIKEAQAEIEHLAFYDELTGLTNRRLILELIEKSILHNVRYQSYNTLLYLDLDRFKSVNDMFGHKVGNDLLIRVSDLLRATLRKEDTIARIGSDEFVILTNLNAESKELAISYANTLGHKIIDTLEKEYEIEGHSLHPSVSVGICIFPVSEFDTPDDIISFADLAMYEAKRLGGHRLQFYQSAMSEEMKARHKLEEALNQSKMTQEFELYYQPQMSPNGELHAAEALIRWHHPVLGFITPDKFIPIAEDGRQILKIGAWVIESAFRQIKTWHELYGLANLSINISPIQFHEPTFVQMILDLQQKTQVLPNTVTFELTESILISNIDEAMNKMSELSNLGFRFSIDDFGTGYSSLSYFQKLPIQELKIDRGFVDRIPASQEDIAIIRTIIQLAASKSLNIVAEGVETEAQIKFFQNCNEQISIQGYFYSKPLSHNEFTEKFLIQKA